jgi:hypothetical protein
MRRDARFAMGKKSKARDCPALGRSITSAECGSGRHATIACPVQCPFNPFSPATYDAFLELETKVDQLCMRALNDALGPDRLVHLLKGPTDPILRDTADEYTRINAAVLPALHVERNQRGQTVAERLLADPAIRLTNDERNLIAAKNRIRVALVEFREIRPDGLLRALDLLEPEAGEFLLLDRATWARAVRFRPMLIWIYPLPHHWRPFGGGMSWPDWTGLDLEPTEGLAEIMVHAGGPGPGTPLGSRREWLARNFVSVLARLDAVTLARRHDMLAGLDVAQGWAEFALDDSASDTLLHHLNNSPATGVIEPDPKEDHPAGFTAAWEWFEPDGSRQEDLPAVARGPVLLGRIVRRDHTWRIIAYSRARLERLREVFLAVVGQPDLRATREFQQDLAAQMAAAKPPVHAELVPPRLRESPVRFNITTTRWDGPPPGDQPLGHDPTWVDAPLPALAGRTPRDAVGDPAGRATVIRLLKPRIADADARRLRGQPMMDDPAAHVGALGLHELDTPVPPPRPCPPDFHEEDVDSDDEDVDGWTPLALPPPASQVLNRAQAEERFDRVIEYYPSNHDLLDAWDSACPGLSDLVYATMDDDITDAEAELVDVAMALGWAILAGHDTRPLALNLELLEQDYDAMGPLLSQAVQEGPTFANILSIFPNHEEVARLILSDLSHRRLELDSSELKDGHMPDVICWLATLLPAYAMALKRS